MSVAAADSMSASVMPLALPIRTVSLIMSCSEAPFLRSLEGALVLAEVLAPTVLAGMLMFVVPPPEVEAPIVLGQLSTQTGTTPPCFAASAVVNFDAPPAFP